MVRSRRARWMVLPLLLLVAAIAPSAQLYADSLQELRLAMGSKLFPSMLAADLNIGERQGSDGSLQLLVVYTQNPDLATRVVEKLEAVSTVRGMPLRITPVSLQALAGVDLGAVGGIFVAEAQPPELHTILDLARSHRVIIFSPYEGDVERGAHGGISVRDRILPYINERALRLSGIELKVFFLKVAERYE